MKVYKQSNIVPPSGYLWFILVALVSGGVVGGIASFIGTFLYLIVLFPLGLGFAAAGATQITIKSGKVRNPTIALIFGALTGASIYGSMHLFDYWRFQGEITQELWEAYGTELDQEIADGGRTKAEIVEEARDGFLRGETGQAGFLGYLQLSAQQGMEISRSGRGGIPIGGVVMWIYWAVELGVVAAIPAALGAGAALDPFNENRNEWYGKPIRIGNVPKEVSEQFLEFLNKDSYGEAGSLINPSAEFPVPSVEVYVHQVPEDTLEDVILALSNTSFDKNQRVQLKRFLLGHLSPNQWNKLNSTVKG